MSIRRNPIALVRSISTWYEMSTFDYGGHLSQSHRFSEVYFHRFLTQEELWQLLEVAIPSL